jgi:CubicO group peptidase (beta-lactamase class C family)
MWRLKAALAALLVLCPGLASAEDCGAPPDLGDGWTTATPESMGFDPAVLCAIGPRFEDWKTADVHAVVVVRDGKLVYERYFTGEDEILGRSLGQVVFDAATKHDERSITKSVTSLLVGVAIDRGWLKDIDAPVFSFFPEYADLRTPEKDKITLRHLLTMSAGFVWDESLPYNNYANSERPMDDAPDPYRYVLSQPMASAPGEQYNYCGCSAALLGAILKKVSGKPVDVLAKEVLFAPLGISDEEWGHAAWGMWGHFDNGDVMPHAALRLRPRDLAKLGQMVLDHGKWRDAQIVSSDWIEQSTSPKLNGDGLFFYGYQWWLGRSFVDGREVDWAAGVGLGGQRLYIVPDKQLVVAFNAGLYNKPLQGTVGNIVLNRYVFPALRD